MHASNLKKEDQGVKTEAWCEKELDHRGNLYLILKEPIFKKRTEMSQQNLPLEPENLKRVVTQSQSSRDQT